MGSLSKLIDDIRNGVPIIVSSEIRELAERISSQPQKKLSKSELKEWVENLAEQIIVECDKLEQNE